MMSMLIWICIGFIMFGFFIILFGIFFSYNKRKLGKQLSNSHQLVDDDGMELKNHIFKFYKDIMTLSSKFQFDKLKNYIIDDYYDEYIEQFKKMKVANEKMVVTGFVLMNMDIIDIKKEKDGDVIQVFLCVNQYDYVIKNGVVIRGTDTARYLVEYQLTILKKEDSFYLMKIICKGKWISIKS